MITIGLKLNKKKRYTYNIYTAINENDFFITHNDYIIQHKRTAQMDRNEKTGQRHSRLLS